MLVLVLSSLWMCINNSKALHVGSRSHRFGQKTTQTALASTQPCPAEEGHTVHSCGQERSWKRHNDTHTFLSVPLLSLATPSALGYLSKPRSNIAFSGSLLWYILPTVPPPMNHFPCTISRLWVYFSILKPSICIVSCLALLLECEP